eukprot:SAG11_NODE_11804_length_737_cov_1.388715_1_plen_72_part_00
MFYGPDSSHTPMEGCDVPRCGGARTSGVEFVARALLLDQALDLVDLIPDPCGAHAAVRVIAIPGTASPQTY